MSAHLSDSLTHDAPGPRAPASRSGIPDATTRTDADSATTSQAAQGVLGATGDLLNHAVSRTGIGFQLALAETRLATMSFLRMLFMAVLAAVLILGAWGVLASGMTLALYRAGLPLWSLLTAIGLIHLAAATWLLLRIRKLSETLDFPQTRALFERPPKDRSTEAGNKEDMPT